MTAMGFIKAPPSKEHAEKTYSNPWYNNGSAEARRLSLITRNRK
jgi:hypothetical protein